MVGWNGDGTVSGYDPISKQLKHGLYKLASPGSVDVNGITRFNYSPPPRLASTVPRAIEISASLTFTPADFDANPGMHLGWAVYMCDAKWFPEGKVPKPSEIIALGRNRVAVSTPDTGLFPPGNYGANGTLTGTAAHNRRSGASLPFDNAKLWVMVIPVAVRYPNGPVSIAHWRPMANINVNTYARAISIWLGRTPEAPTITSPPSGSVYLPGAEFNLIYSPNSPDKVNPNDALGFNSDLNGVQFQYAPVPTPGKPSPEWRDLQMTLDWTSVGFTLPTDAWYFRGSRYLEGTLESVPELRSLVDNRRIRVVAGTDWPKNKGDTGKAGLPTGEWQLRCRTTSYGNCYPNEARYPRNPGPVGTDLKAGSPDESFLIRAMPGYLYPKSATSPWSEPIRVTIPAQVPPPKPISPTENRAVPADSGVRLSWLYRNTHQPPRSQYLRAVQLREVGDESWKTVINEVSSAAFVNLPLTFTPVPKPDLAVFTDPSFEGGTQPWSNQGSFVTQFSNSSTAGEAHSGVRFIEATNYTAPPRNLSFGADFWFHRTVAALPDPDYTAYTLKDAWVYIDAPTKRVSVEVMMQWMDSSGDFINGPNPAAPADTPYISIFRSRFFQAKPGWRKVSAMTPDMAYTGYGEGVDMGRLAVTRPPNGVTLDINVTINTENPTSGELLIAFMKLDDWVLEASAGDREAYSLDIGKNYEWRVQVTDTDGIASDYSEPARFWMVAPGNSGEVKPLPSDTIDGATLGCGTHRAFIFRRGGTERVGEIRGISHVDWSRVRDDISTAKVTVSGWDLDCGNLLSRLQTWAYELVIFRDNGYSTDRVWEGPITLLTYETDKVTIDAKDVMGYAYRRIIRQRMTDSGKGNGTTVTNRAQRVIQNAFAPDDPNVLAYLQVIARDDDAMQYRSTPAFSRTAFEEVDDMAANAGLDYTCVGRSILLWGTKHRIGTLPEFRDADLGNAPIVSEYGMSMANFYAVSDGNGVHGEADRLEDGADEVYGLVEMLSSTWASDSEEDSGTYTQEGLATVIKSFEGFAERSIADRYPPPVVVRVPDNTPLNPDTVISIQHLVPGVAIPLRSTQTLREVSATQKLDSVKVVEEAGKETITVTMSPFSRDDAEAIEEEGGA